MDAAMRIFELTKSFPATEKHSLIDSEYEGILAMLATMAAKPNQWTIRQ